MEKDEKGEISFYAGADYGLDPDYGVDFLGFKDYRVNSANFGFPTDPRTSNQLQAVSQKLNIGAKTIEVSGVSAAELESIPKQHFKEINRLKQLTGVDLTFHGPIIEASGFGQEGWKETARQGAERQMWSAVERAHDLEPKGNIVVTFHSAAGLPEMTVKTKDEKGEEISEMLVVNESFGERIQPLQRVRVSENPLLGKKFTVKDELEQLNKENWTRPLTQLSFHAYNGERSIKTAIQEYNKLGGSPEFDGKSLMELYKISKTTEGQEMMEKELSPQQQQLARSLINEINYGEIYVRDAYNDLQSYFKIAYDAAKREKKEDDIQKLEDYRAELKQRMEKTNFEDPKNIIEFSDEVQKGFNVLNSISTPKLYRPLNDFAIEKSGQTFGNIAFNSYKKFKDSAPIISIENPPAGGGLSRGEDLKELVKEARKNFVKKAKDELGMGEEEAKKQAEKLIGVTWDVGHINMLRKFGYKDKDILKETEKVAPFIKHIHLSDNFGYEHTELPMGMGNVPTKQHLEAIQKYNKQMQKMKQIVETGGAWFRDFKITPFKQTLRAFGSPLYSMQMSPYWNQVSDSSGGYFAGYGRFLPEQHFNLYGSGFSNLPVELGGQMAGTSRASGTPIE